MRTTSLTERDIQVAAVAWAAGVLATTVLVLVSYLLWWRAEQAATPTTRRTP